ncbi:site-2 protease family protein [bacterium]|nr:site-2 protease family protein [bacterium]
MNWSIKIARLRGIDIYIHFSFLLIVAWVGLTRYLQKGDVNEGLYGVLFVVAVFGMVVLHELGHALAAQWYGIGTKDITLYLIGGVARLERIPENPKQELVVALAGPMVNVVLAIIFYLILAGVPNLEVLTHVESVGSQLLAELFWVNVSLVLFNMIPAFPMDGGRVLRALLAMFLPHARATQIAAGLGQALAFGLGFWGLMSGSPVPIFIAFFVWMAAGQEAYQVNLKNALAGVPVSDAMITRYQTVSPGQPVRDVVDLILTGFQQDFPVISNGQVVGMLTRSDVVEHVKSAGESVSVESAMTHEYCSADPFDTLEQAFFRLQESKCRSMPVVHRGKLVGLLTPENVGEFMMLRDAIARR